MSRPTVCSDCGKPATPRKGGPKILAALVPLRCPACAKERKYRCLVRFSARREGSR